MPEAILIAREDFGYAGFSLSLIGRGGGGTQNKKCFRSPRFYIILCELVGRSCGVSVPDGGQLGVDDLLELSFRLHSAQELAVDNEGWCRVYSGLGACLKILLDHRLILTGFHAGLERLVVHTQPGGSLSQGSFV